MNKPLVSIIIPVYNGANFIAEAIECVLIQTYANIEILVVNDGSNDNGATENAVLSYGDRVRYISKPNGGVSSALNLGIKEMKGEYFSWLSHDDLYKPTKIEVQVSAITSDKDIILCSGSLMSEHGNHIPYSGRKLQGTYSGIDLFKEFLKGYNLNGLGFLIPKSAFAQIGTFDESMRYLQDLDEWLRLLMYDYNFVCQKEELVITRIHSQQQTNTISNLFDVDREKMGEKFINIIKNSDFDDKKKNTLLLLFLYLFTKGKNVVGIKKVRDELIIRGYSNIDLFFKTLPYKTYGILKNIFRFLYNSVLKIKGFRN